MAIGDQVFVSSPAPGNTIRKLNDGESFTIGPGQFAYILTHEIVRIPCDVLGFISINATTKFAGLVNISGFHVDPGYHGRIIFSVFNAGPNVIHLRRGERLFPLWLANLDQPARTFPAGKGFFEIPPRLITAVSGNYTTAFELNGLVRDMRKELDSLHNDVTALKSTRWHLGIFIVILAFFLSGFLRDIGISTWNSLAVNFTWFGFKLPATQTAPVPPILPANTQK